MNFIYSQNSINTYKSCPLKFKYKYVDNLSWKKEDSKEYYDSLFWGSEFHLVCERFLNNIPIGDISNEKFYDYLEKVKNVVSLNSKNLFTEYEIRYNFEGKIITAKYDLLIIDDDKIEIWDWKTENKKMDYKNYSNRVQTMVYLFLASEVLPVLFNKNIEYKNISMNYYQVEFNEGPIKITHSEDKHLTYKNNIKNYIDLIQSKMFNTKNEKHCKYCEFNRLCNKKEV